MTPETLANLEYLKQLHAKYNRYLGKYFGFTLSGIAEFIGLKKAVFSQIIKGTRNLTDEHEQAFNQAFEQFQIYSKTKDFKENSWQVGMREMWAKQKNS